LNPGPIFFEWTDLIVVHAGLEPGKTKLTEMDPLVLMNIRTWDGIGKNLKKASNPPWYKFFELPKMVVFGHWAKRGLVDLSLFKGLDTGCVYGKKLTGYCPEEGKYYQVNSHRAYQKII